MKYYLSFLIVLLLSVSSQAQERTVFGLVRAPKTNDSLNAKNTKIVQKRAIFGHVRDAETGDSLKRASIGLWIRGMKASCIADTSGFYRINIPDDSTAILLFSYVGYENQEVRVGNNKLIDVALKRKVEEPLQVTVTARVKIARD